MESEGPTIEPERGEDVLLDAVTGLPSGALLRDRLRMALVRRRRPRFDSLAVMCVHIDGVADLGTRRNQSVVNGALQAAAARLSELLRAGDTVSRTEGAEFVVICEELGGEEESLAITERVVRAFEKPLRVGDAAYEVRASVGLVVIAGGELDLDRVLDEARRAMRRGRGDDASRFSP